MTDNTEFLGKTHAEVTATTGTIIRVWDNDPDTAIVPATDDQGKRFELVFAGARKALFDAHAQAGVAENGLTLAATGFWRKRTWKKTRTTGGWGHTWQFVVAAWTQAGERIGTVPDMQAPAIG